VGRSQQQQSRGPTRSVASACVATRGDAPSPVVGRKGPDRNEYIRGSTLRFLSKIHEQELIEPLTDSIMSNLDHRCPHPGRHL